MTARLACIVVLLGALPALALEEPGLTSVPEEFMSFGMKLTVPQEWNRLPEARATVVGRWAKLRPDDKTIEAIVSVEFEPRRGRSRQTVAAELAKRARGMVESDMAELGGELASRVLGNLGGEDDDTVRPMEALVTAHGDFIYLVIGFDNGPGDAHTIMLQELRLGWEFCDVQPPSNYLDLRLEPFSVGGKFTFKPLATMRPTPADSQRRDMVQLRTFNLRRNRPEFVMTIQVLTVPPGATLEQLGESALEQSGIGRDVKVEWKDVSDDPRRILSRTIYLGRTERQQIPVRLGLVKLNDREAAMVNFAFPTPDNFDRIMYEDRSEMILNSVQIIEN